MTPAPGRVPETAAMGELEWLSLSEGLIAGINHALNNRLAALGAAGQVLEADLPAGHPLSGIFTTELQKLEKSVALLRSLTGGDAEAEPTMVDELLGQARQLLAVDHALRDHPLEITCPPGLFPLWVQPAGLLRLLLLMVHSAAHQAANPLARVAVEASGDAAFVSIEVSAPCANDRTSEGNAREGLIAYAAKLGGELGGVHSPERNGLRLTLPTLPEVRRRERAKQDV